MNFMKSHMQDAVFVCVAVAMCSLLEWDKNAIKCFVSGGVIAWWIARRSATR